MPVPCLDYMLRVTSLAFLPCMLMLDEVLVFFPNAMHQQDRCTASKLRKFKEEHRVSNCKSVLPITIKSRAAVSWSVTFPS